jgi:hypothetical protein
MNVSVRALNVITGLFPGVICFVAFPVLYFINNQQYLGDVHRAFYGFAFALFIWTMLILWAVALAGGSSAPIGRILFWLGVYILSADVLAPMPIGLPATGGELLEVAEPRRDSLVQRSVTMAVLIVAFLVK